MKKPRFLSFIFVFVLFFSAQLRADIFQNGFLSALGIALDNDENILVTDGVLFAIAKVDPLTKERTTVSGPGVGTGPAFKSPTALTVEADGNILVADFGLSAVVRVDPATGNRTIVSNTTTGVGLDFVILLAIDVKGDGTIVVADIVNGIMTVDPVSGNRTPLSNNFGTGFGPPFGLPAGVGIGLDEFGVETLLVADFAFGAIINVDLTNGNRTPVTGLGVGTGDDLRGPRDMRIEPDGKTIIVADQGYDSVVRVNFSTGNRTLLSGGTGTRFVAPRGIALAEIAGSERIFVVDQGLASVFLVDPSNQDRFLVTGENKTPALLQPRGIIIGPDTGYEVADLLKLNHINHLSGRKAVISGLGGGAGVDFIFPTNSVIIDGNYFVVTDFGLKSLVKVNPTTGARQILSGPTRGTGIALVSPQQGITVQSDGFLLVTDGGVVKRVNPVTGDRSLVSGSGMGAGPAFVFPFDIKVEKNGQLIVVDLGQAAIFRVDPTTGDRTIISSNSVGAGPSYAALLGVGIESDGSLIVSDIGGKIRKIFRVDPVTGDRVILSDLTVSGGPGFLAQEGIAIDSDGIIFSADFALSAVFKIDPVTGQRTLVSSIYPGIFIPIDIDPGTFPNVISLSSPGEVCVAILSTLVFDARRVDPETVTLAGAAAKTWEETDVNGNGLIDLVICFDIADLTNLNILDTEAILEGFLSDGTPIRGSDPVVLTP